MKDIKVGDKIRVTDKAFCTFGRYKEGDILTVEAVISDEDETLYIVKEFRTPYLREKEVEFHKAAKSEYKAGDTVRIIDKPWNHPKWQSLTRATKKRHARHIGKEFEVNTGKILYSFGQERIQACCENVHEYLIVDFLEKVEQLPKIPKPGDLFRVVDNSHGCHCFEIGEIVKFVEIQIGEYEVKGYSNARKRIVNQIVYKEDVEPLKEPKSGDLFKVVGKGNNYHNFELGEIVEFLNVDPSGMFELRGYIKNRGEVGDQILYKSDLEPYTKHRYTDEQIAEAEQIIGKIVASLPDWDNFFFRREGSETMLYVMGNANKQNSAKCRETDEYNQTIGRMIALCNHTGHKRPDWL